MFRFATRSLLSGLMSAVLISLAVGCTSTSGVNGSETASDPEDSAALRLWRRKCIECHGLYAPSSYSDSEWVLIMDDMAGEAHLTEAEQSIILALMQKNND